jgi:hypothetical protein
MLSPKLKMRFLDRIKTLNQGRSFEPIRGGEMVYRGKNIVRVDGIGRGQNSQNTSDKKSSCD